MTRLPFLRFMADIGGIASTRELGALHLRHQEIRLYNDRRVIQRVRRGWYAHPGLPEALRTAWRWGGLLSCTSADVLRDHYGVDAQGFPAFYKHPEYSPENPWPDFPALPTPLHIVVPCNSAAPTRASHQGAAVVVVHWRTLPDHDITREGRRPAHPRAPRTLVASAAIVANATSVRCALSPTCR